MDHTHLPLIGDRKVTLSLIALLALATVINIYIYRQSTVFRSTRSQRVRVFLVLVSLERAFALIWPLRHRVTSTKVYIYSVAIIWLAGLCLGALNFLTTNGIIDFRHYLFAYSIIIFLSLFVICSSYLLIRKRLCNRNPAIDEADCRKRVEQNAKFSKTLFIVIGASVTLWAPSMTLYNINNLWLGLLPGFMNYLTNFLHVTNSLVNPIIYSFRIAVFKKTLKQLANKLRICRPPKSYTNREKI